MFHSLMWLFVQLCSATIYIYIYIFLALVLFPYILINFFLKNIITVSYQAEVIMGGKVEACAECTKKCLRVHRSKAKLSPVIYSFFKIMIGKECSEILVCLLCEFSSSSIYRFSLFFSR